MPHLVDHFIEQFGGVGDYEESAFVLFEVAAQPFDGVGVQVVCGFVEDQGVGVREQDARQFDASALAAGQGAQGRLITSWGSPRLEAMACASGLCGVSAGFFEILHRLVVAVHRLRHHVRVGVGHVPFRFAQACDDGGDVTGAHHAVERSLLRVGGMGVLRQVAEFAADAHRAGGGQQVAGDHTREGGLARAVAADKADLVAFAHVEVGGVQQGACTDLNLESLRFDWHASPSFLCCVHGV